jgi:hypothetical protein
MEKNEAYLFTMRQSGKIIKLQRKTMLSFQGVQSGNICFAYVY